MLIMLLCGLWFTACCWCYKESNEHLHSGSDSSSAVFRLSVHTHRLTQVCYELSAKQMQCD